MISKSNVQYYINLIITIIPNFIPVADRVNMKQLVVGIIINCYCFYYSFLPNFFPIAYIKETSNLLSKNAIINYIVVNYIILIILFLKSVM
jgi:hypothetical protein